MNPLQNHSHASRSGLTLIEILMAVAIAALTLTLFMSTYRTVHLAVHGQEARKRGQIAAAEAVQRIADDLTRAFGGASIEPCEFAIKKGERGFSSLEFCADHMDEGNELVPYRLVRVSYQVVTGEDALPSLVRTENSLAGPQHGATTNTIVNMVRTFQIEAYNGIEWTSSWPNKESDHVPQAARLIIAAGDDDRYETMVYLPAGNAFTSSMTRTSSPVR